MASFLRRAITIERSKELFSKIKKRILRAKLQRENLISPNIISNFGCTIDYT